MKPQIFPLYRRILVCFVLLFCTCYARGQGIDTNAVLDSWRNYASDTNLTYLQIVTTCDSLFNLVGYPKVDTTAANDSVAAIDTEDDENSYFDYCLWRRFWETRLDAATGKLHNFAAEIGAKFQNGSPYNDCQEQSYIQSLIGTLPPNPQGWEFVGPKNVSEAGGGDPLAGFGGNQMQQFLGRATQVFTNPNNQNEIYIANRWGGIWHTIDANLAPNNHWVCLTDHDAQIAGIGVQALAVDFNVSPHRLYFVAGIPEFNGWYLYSFTRPVGLFCSIDDGTTFHYINVSVVIPNIYDDNINDIKLWSSTPYSGANFLFVATKYRVLKIDAAQLPADNYTPTYPAHIYPLVDVWTGNLSGRANPGERFHYFSEVYIDANNSDLWVTSTSNDGHKFPLVTSLFKIYNATGCTSCSYVDKLPDVLSPTDVVMGGGFMVAPPGDHWWYDPAWTVGGGSAFCSPTSSSPHSLEVTVYGNYTPLPAVQYEIDFYINSASNAYIQPILADVNNTNNFLVAYPNTGMFTYSLTPSSGTGHYHATWTSTDYVCRLELVAMSPTSGNINITNVQVHQLYCGSAGNFAISKYGPVSNKLYFDVSKPQAGNGDGDRIIMTPNSGSTFSSINFAYPFAVSSYDDDRLYMYEPQVTYAFGSPPYYIRKFSFNSSLGLNTAAIMASTVPDIQSIYMHEDIRSLCILPNQLGYSATDDNIWVGNDGGIAYRKNYMNPSTTYTNLNGIGFGCSFAWGIGTSIHTGKVGLAATDNGLITSTTPFAKWAHIGGGDGAWVSYGKRYVSRNMQLYKNGSDAGGNALNITVDDVTNSPIFSPQIYGIVLDPGNYLYKQALFKVKTTFGGEYFGKNVPKNNIYNIKFTGAGPYTIGLNCLTCSAANWKTTDGTDPELVQAIAPDMYDPNYIAVFTHTGFWDNGYFQYMVGGVWQPAVHNIAANNQPQLPIADMAVDPRPYNGSKRLWAGTYWYTSPAIQHVYQSLDGGQTWADYSTGLPDGPVNALVYDEQSHYLFAGTDRGVYARNVEGGSSTDPNLSDEWHCYSMNLPNSFIDGLDINRCTGKLYASLVGRGAYWADLPQDWNWNGAIDPTDNFDLDIISSNTTWSQDRDEVRSVLIKPGVTLTIQNCTINMGRNKNIIVMAHDGSNQGGTLIVQNATITNTCGAMWGCINVLGDPAQAQSLLDANLHSNQGVVILRNVGGKPIIENAYTGIFVGGMYYDGTDGPVPTQTQNGGIVKADNAIFHNCSYGSRIFPYTNPQTSHFNQCTFLADDSLHNVYYTDYTLGPNFRRKFGMKEGINYASGSGLYISGCTFITQDNPANGFAPDLDLRGAGYVGSDASATIIGCVFEQKTRGIYDYNLSTLNYPVITNNKFNTCWRATSFHNVNNLFFLYNNIRTSAPIVHYGGYAALGLTGAFNEYNNPQPVGVYFSQARTYNIKNNSISGENGCAHSYGIILNGTYNVPDIGPGHIVNELKLNHIIGNSFGVDMLQNNYYTQVKCNELLTSAVGLFVDKLFFNMSLLSPQGYNLNPAANTFSQPANNIINSFPWSIASVWGNPPYPCNFCPWNWPLITNGDVQYTTFTNAPFWPYKVSDYNTYYNYYFTPCNGISLHTTKIYVNSANTKCNNGLPECCTVYPGSGLRIRDTAVVIDTTLPQVPDSLFTTITFAEADSGMTSLQMAYDSIRSIIDSGNDPALFVMVNDPTLPSSYIKTNLLAVGPRLSDSLLKALIDRTVPLDDSDLKQVILANSGLQPGVWNEFAYRDSVLATDSDIVFAQGIESARTTLEGAVTDVGAKMNNYIQAFHSYYIETSDYTSLATMYSNLGMPELAYYAYMQANDMSNASAKVSQLSDPNLVSLFNIQINNINNHFPIDTIASPTDSTTIVTIADSTESHAAVLAGMWYCKNYNLNYLEVMPFDSTYYDSSSTGSVDTTTARRGYKSNSNNGSNLDVQTRNSFSIYPNPANSFVIVKDNEGLWGAGASVIAVDMYGRKLVDIKPDKYSDIATVNTSMWTSGIYVFTIRLAGGYSYTQKVTIRRE